MIEIAPKKFWIWNCTYDQACLYIRFVEIDGQKDWRLPSANEWNRNESIPNGSWYRISPDLQQYNGSLYRMSTDLQPYIKNQKRICIPVRNVDD